MKQLESKFYEAKTLRGVFFALDKLLIIKGKKPVSETILIELEKQIRSVWRSRDNKGSKRNSPLAIEKMTIKRVKNIYREGIEIKEILSFVDYIAKNYR